MPFIDPSEMLLDPEFTDRFAVVQRIQMTDVNGTVSSSDTTIPSVIGIVLPASPSDIKRYPDKKFGQRSLNIVTQFRLNSAARNVKTGQYRLPDHVLHEGDIFVVVDLKPYTRYGPGWTKVLVTSIDAVEALT